MPTTAAPVDITPLLQEIERLRAVERRLYARIRQLYIAVGRGDLNDNLDQELRGIKTLYMGPKGRRGVVVQRIRAERRQIALMMYEEGETYEKVGKRLGICKRAAGRLICRARRERDNVRMVNNGK